MKKNCLFLIAAALFSAANMNPANATVPTDSLTTAVADTVAQQDSVVYHPTVIDYAKKLNNKEYFQVVRFADDGEILEISKVTGIGIEIFAGANYISREEHFSPEGGVGLRYDGKHLSYRANVALSYRQQNDESLDAGDHYFTYMASAALHVNLIYPRPWKNCLSLYGEAGYIFDQHKQLVDEVTDEDGQAYVRYVSHKGSGLLFGGGFEYRHNFFAKSHSLVVRAGAKVIPDAFWNVTKSNCFVEMSIGWVFGLKRGHWVSPNKKAAYKGRL